MPDAPAPSPRYDGPWGDVPRFSCCGGPHAVGHAASCEWLAKWLAKTGVKGPAEICQHCKEPYDLCICGCQESDDTDDDEPDFTSDPDDPTHEGWAP